MSKPEYRGPPEHFYDEVESRKYTTNSRIRKIQAELSERALELLELPANEEDDSNDNGKQHLLLDIGCGSGLSGQVLSEKGHMWVGVDISRHMLEIAREDEETDGELLLLDMGNGVPFRAGVFDGAISISAIQWLCHSNSKKHDPRRRLYRFFESLFACLSRRARAVFQFYPENQQQCELISQQALRAGFQGGLVVDNPDSPKHRKVFLVLSAGKEAAIVHHPGIRNRTAANKDEEEEEDDEQQVKSQIQMIGRGTGSVKGKHNNKLRHSGKRQQNRLKAQAQIVKRQQRRQRRKAAKGGDQATGNADGDDAEMDF